MLYYSAYQSAQKFKNKMGVEAIKITINVAGQNA